MTLVKDFNDLHIGIKSAFLTILSQMPFFFIATYLFRHDIIVRVSQKPFVDMNFYFLLSILFCFSLTWFFMNVALSYLTLNFVDSIIKSAFSPSELYISTMVQSVLYISAIICLSYFFKWTFICFISIAYGYILFRITWVLTVTRWISKHLHNKTNYKNPN